MWDELRGGLLDTTITERSQSDDPFRTWFNVGLPATITSHGTHLAFRPTREPVALVIAGDGVPARTISISELDWNATIPESTFSAAFPVERPRRRRPPPHPR